MNLQPYRLPIGKETKPFAEQPFPISHVCADATRQKVGHPVRLGVLEPDEDLPWASPAFVIPKKDGTARLLSDFIRLNQDLVRRYYLLPKS